jgi:hypothetical protein
MLKRAYIAPATDKAENIVVLVVDNFVVDNCVVLAVDNFVVLAVDNSG